MELTPDCALVASGRLGFGLSDPWDGHAYLVQSEGEAALIDTGSGRASAALAERIERRLDGGRLVAILVTHAHVDHAGGAAELSERFGVGVLASPEVGAILSAGDEEAAGLPGAIADGVYPEGTRLRAVADVRPAAEVRVGSLLIRPVPTPGHSAGHLAFVADLAGGRALFSGDLVFARGRVAILDLPDVDLDAYERSLRDVAALGIAQLFPGHGSIALSDGAGHIAEAVNGFREGRPRPLI